MEIPYGTFQRVIKLPAPVKLGEAEAQYADGFLEILIPKAKRTPRRKIYITVNW
jgi:HSP20 family protein